MIAGLADTRTHGDRPGERKIRLSRQVLRNRQADVLRLAHDSLVPPTYNQAERDLRASRVQQNIAARLTSEERTTDRYRVRGCLSTAAKHGQNTIDALRALNNARQARKLVTAPKALSFQSRHLRPWTKHHVP